ncbi:CU044_5270 family protein [Saccharothrix lopnurensis]|uniref:CU044_5270 family protein n=1 Tax=Saccharothrix lopnurensis TaxID=1670621 RepID=A0ABW1P155_9PSEU
MRELDDALDLLHRDARTSDAPLDAVRARVLAAAADEGAAASPSSPRSRRWYAPVAVAAAAALVAGVLAVDHRSRSEQPLAVPGAGSASPAPEVRLLSAPEYLNLAADAITATDLPLAPGQYRYIAAHQWNSISMVFGRPADQPTAAPAGYTWLRESRYEKWIPRDQSQDWMERRTPLEGLRWLGGTVPEAEAPEPEITETDTGERRGRCGDFFPEARPKKVCGDPADWDNPGFYDALPRDPQAIVAYLRDATAHRGSAPTAVFHWGVEILRTGLMPADLRAQWYRALALLEGVTAFEQGVNLDGRTGVAIGMESPLERRELIIDPATGDFIGERTAAGPESYDPWIEPGTVTGFSSITTTVVDGIGQTG